MQKLNLKLLIAGIIAFIAFTSDAQVKYIYLKISQPNVEECITGIENTFKNCDINIFPNPSKGEFTLEINNVNAQKEFDLSVYDISGKEILNQQIRVFEKLKEIIDLSRYNKGTYVINIRGEHNDFFKATLIIY